MTTSWDTHRETLLLSFALLVMAGDADIGEADLLLHGGCRRSKERGGGEVSRRLPDGFQVCDGPFPIPALCCCRRRNEKRDPSQTGSETSSALYRPRCQLQRLLQKYHSILFFKIKAIFQGNDWTRCDSDVLITSGLSM